MWFFSLDADSWPIVWGGRNLYGLPYHGAAMRQRWTTDGWCSFSSRRRNGGVRFETRYRPSGDVFAAKAGSFEHWLAERYCLYAPGRRGGLTRVEVHHVPWPLQRADCDPNSDPPVE